MAPSPQAPAALTALDAALFAPDGWRALTKRNQQVTGVYPADLSAALALISRGNVATIYGRLAPHTRVVDIDLGPEHGADGYAVVDALEAWAAEHGVWTLTRPSGGGDGRHHVYVLVHDDDRDHLHALTAEVARLREWAGVPSSLIDVRQTVRPLSAPHRTGTFVAPYGDPAAALTELRRRLAKTQAVTTTGTRQDTTANHSDQGSEPHDDRRTPLTPRPRPKRPLPPDWASYLVTGIAPAVGGTDRTGSTVEVIAIKHMIRAGYTWRDTVRAIFDAHDDAMTRARTRGMHRLIGIWNRAVIEDAAWTAEHGITRDPLPPELATAIDHARARAHAHAWTLTPRQRPAVLLVVDALLDRMARQRTLRVPCPERCLAEDTSLDRGTIRAVLHHLHGTVGTLHTDVHSHSPRHRATSSHEFEIPAAEEATAEGVREIPPPSSHTPFPTAPGTWATLPTRAHQLHRVLPDPGTPGLPLADLATTALATDTPTSTLTTSQARTLTDTLRALARAGLAYCDEHGRWTRAHSLTPEHAERAATVYADQLDRHHAERIAYRAVVGTDWLTAQRDALARNHAREQAWWRSLTPTERATRRDDARARYRALPLVRQADVKHALAARRQRAGINEADRHAAWLNAWHPDALAQRQAEHHAAYHALPAPLRAAYAAMWQHHREQWAILHPTPVRARA